ncbi:LOW QUALITY PROTEIN: hypothetical protein V2J09_007085 [Rumex salicifolius]
MDTTFELSKLWHDRYGHLSYKGLQLLQSKHMVIGLLDFSTTIDTCLDCVNEKQIRSSIPKQGGEFNAFDEFCKEEGIRRQLTNAYTPQQIGITERKNRTVMNMVRSLQIAKKKLEKFWAEAVKWAFHVPNCCCQIDHTSGSVEWNQVVCCSFPNMGLPCPCSYSNRKPSENTKGYKLYDVEKNKIIISRDFVFEEKENNGEERNEIQEDRNGEPRIAKFRKHKGESKMRIEKQRKTMGIESDETRKTRVREIVVHTEAQNSETQTSELNLRRERRVPRWMDDYIRVKLNSDEGGTLVDATHYKQIVGSLMYLTATRPDLIFATSLISIFGIFYKRNGEVEELQAYADSDYVKIGRVLVDMLFCSILLFTEAEFVATVVCACQAIWMKELGFKGEDNTNIRCDNSSTIKKSKNPIMHGRSKHIDVRFHFLRNLSAEGTISLSHRGSAD